MSHYKAVSSILRQDKYRFLDKSKQNQPECIRENEVAGSENHIYTKMCSFPFQMNSFHAEKLLLPGKIIYAHYSTLLDRGRAKGTKSTPI